MKHTRELAYLRQLCCSGLSKEIVMPEFLRAVQHVIHSSSNVGCDVTKKFAPSEFFLGYDVSNIPDFCTIMEDYWTPQRIFLYASWFTKFPIFTNPLIFDPLFYTSDFYGELCLKSGQHYMIATPATYLGNPVAIITLNRPRNKPTFNEQEHALFLRLMPYVAYAVTTAKTQDTPYCENGNIGMMVMDSQGTVLYQSQEAKNLLDLACFPSITPDAHQHKSALMAKLRSLCINLDTIFRGNDAAPPSYCHINGRGRFIFRAQWLDSLATEPDNLIGMTIEHQEPLLLKILRALQFLPLSPAQKEVAQMLAQGLSTEDICQRLHIKRTTFKDHLGKIFTKLDINSRVELLPLLLAKSEKVMLYH